MSQDTFDEFNTQLEKVAKELLKFKHKLFLCNIKNPWSELPLKEDKYITNYLLNPPEGKRIILSRCKTSSDMHKAFEILDRVVKYLSEINKTLFPSVNTKKERKPSVSLDKRNSLITLINIFLIWYEDNKENIKADLQARVE